MQDQYTISSALLLILLVLAFVLLLTILHKVMKEKENGLEWWQFISTRASNGKNYADIDKLGKVVGIFVSSWYIIKMGMDSKPDASVLGVYLAFVGGIAGYSAYLRSQRDVVSAETSYTETTTVKKGDK
jgi:hypothetical protein